MIPALLILIGLCILVATDGDQTAHVAAPVRVRRERTVRH